MARLFRDEALKAQESRLLGDVVVAQPVALRYLVLFLAVIVIAVGTFAALASYARKETVVGYVSPARGIVRVSANQPGVISDLLVKEGDAVSAGAALMTIRSDHVNGNGVSVNGQMIRSVETQLRELDHLERLLANRSRQQAEQLNAEIRGLQNEDDAIRERIEAQRRLVDITTANLERLRTLAADGYVSSQDIAAKEEMLLSAEQLLSALGQEQASIRSRRQQARLVLDQLPLEIEEKQSDLRSRRADLQLRRMQLTGQDSMTIVAPVAGTVSAAAVVIGDSVSSQQHLLTLLPTDSKLEAHLHVPTRAIGFVTEGQEVRILYDAFDYRRYGVQQGWVREISTAMLPADGTSQRAFGSEPSYLVRVELSDQVFRTMHKAFAWQPGMTLRADIVLERRSLLSWIANPILALRGRT